jgi:glycosyltransferase involved in cell wall biosynthesis
VPPDDHPLITLVLHKFSRGGSDRVAAYLARGFVEAGFRTELVVFARGGEVEQVLLELIGDVPVHYLGRSSGFRFVDLLGGLPALAHYIRRSRPDVLLSTANNTALASALGLALARDSSSLLVLKTTNPVAGSRHRGMLGWLRSWSYRRIFGRTARVWTLSDEETDALIAEYPKFSHLFRTIVQPYVTDAMLAPPGPRAGQAKIILSVARLTEQKRLDRLLRAFAHVQTAGARLVICGEGEERQKLSALAVELGIVDRLELRGYVPDVSVVIREADLMVLTSDYEGLPAAALEAMASNCPVLTTDCFPSARSLIESAPACAIIDDDSPRALGAMLDAMLAQPRPTGLAGIAMRYSIANGVQSHVNELQQLLGCSSQRSIAATGKASD